MNTPYRFKCKVGEWYVQRRWLGFLWIDLRHGGPYGSAYSGWTSIHAAAALLRARIINSAYAMMPAMRMRRTKGLAGHGPVPFRPRSKKASR